MPYQSIVSLTLDSLVKYPFRLLGFCRVNEVASVHVPMMTEYREPRATFTDSIELTLSSDKADIGTVEVTIMPVLRGLVYFMWYFPVSTAILCISIMMGFQLSLYMVYIVINFLISYLISEGEGNGAGSRTYTSVARTSSLDRVEEEEQSSVKEEEEDDEDDDDDDDDDDDKQAGSGITFTDYTSRRSDALSSSSSSSGSSETSGSYNFVDDTSSAADVDTSGNEIEAVLIDEAAGDNPNLRKRK